MGGFILKIAKNFLGIFLCILLAGCCRTFEVIQDIRELPQDHHAYFAQNIADKNLLSENMQAERQQQYNRLFFQPWHQGKTLYTREETQGFFR